MKRPNVVFITGLFSVLLATLLFLADRCRAEAVGAEAKDPIYVVDMQKVIGGSIIGKAAKNNIESEIKKKRVIIEKSKLEVDKLKQEIDKQASLLSESALSNKREQLEKKQKEFERAYQDEREDIAQKNQEEMQKVVKMIDETVRELADKNDYKLVMEKDLRYVVYVDEQYDISDEVIKLLDGKSADL